THDQVEAMTLSDRVVVMNRGRIEQVGTPVEVYRRPETRFVADFIGRANFIEATVLDGHSGDLVVQVLGQTLRLGQAAGGYPQGARVTLIARPEMIQVGETGQLRGVVRRAAYLGNLFDYDIQVADQLLTVVDTDPRHTVMFAEGAEVAVSLLADCMHVLPG
ncbi:MAG: TOBE domain-containing protein, partial [Chloroflexota bacterium]